MKCPYCYLIIENVHDGCPNCKMMIPVYPLLSNLLRLIGWFNFVCSIFASIYLFSNISRTLSMPDSPNLIITHPENLTIGIIIIVFSFFLLAIFIAVARLLEGQHDIKALLLKQLFTNSETVSTREVVS
jgi:hypothetical protein